ncbi:MAG: hypothetical protein JWN47_909 [Frankiales bacterium]|nr:hypothetical protein [Frankiales bacterium]
MFRLPDGHATADLGEVVTATRHWRQVAARNGLSERELHLMQPAFGHGETVAADAITATGIVRQPTGS